MTYQRIYSNQTKFMTSLEPTIILSEFNKLLPVYAHRIGMFLPEDRTTPILDCPCGYGNVAYYLSSCGYSNVEAIDIDAGRIALARSLGLSSVFERDAFSLLEGVEGRYGAIISLDFLEHLEKNKVFEFLDLSIKALRTGGVIILRMPCAEAPFHGVSTENDFTHQWSATSGVIRNILHLCGFEKIEIHADTPVPYNSLNRLRLFAYFATRAACRFWANFTGIGTPNIWTPNMWIVAQKGGN